MMSSTADVMNGGLAVIVVLGWRESPIGDSSSWKARSTERRRKNVENVLKGSIRVLVTFFDRADVVRKVGALSGCDCGAASETLLSSGG